MAGGEAQNQVQVTTRRTHNMTTLESASVTESDRQKGLPVAWRRENVTASFSRSAGFLHICAWVVEETVAYLAVRRPPKTEKEATDFVVSVVSDFCNQINQTVSRWQLESVVVHTGATDDAAAVVTHEFMLVLYHKNWPSRTTLQARTTFRFSSPVHVRAERTP